MTAQEKVDLALRSAMIAQNILRLTNVSTKLQVRLILKNHTEMMGDLEHKIQSLLED